MEETKADLADATGDFSWTNGDQVKVIRSDGQEALYAYSESKFAPVGEPLEKNGEPMHAFFPAGNFVWDTDHVQFTMPAAFESLTGIMNPMAAVVPADATAETSITLLNLGAIYEIRMTRAQTKGETVTKIELGNTGVKITGSAAVSFDGAGTPSIGGLNGEKSVSLEFASPVTLTDEAKSVYFFLPVTGPQYYYLAAGLDNIANGTFPDVGNYFATHNEALPIPGYAKGFFYQCVASAHETGEQPTAAFPSSHVGVTTILMILAWRSQNRKLFYGMLPLFILMCFATVYIQAHYVIDVLGGWVSGIIIFAVLHFLYGKIWPIRK
jgi:hypothetical protein